MSSLWNGSLTSASTGENNQEIREKKNNKNSSWWQLKHKTIKVSMCDGCLYHLFSYKYNVTFTTASTYKFFI